MIPQICLYSVEAIRINYDFRHTEHAVGLCHKLGLVILDGKLDVLLDPGFYPAVGSIFKFFLFGPGALSGTFASIRNDYFNGSTEKWVLLYNNVGGYIELEAQPAPEPGSFLLLGTGLLIVAYGVRRLSAGRQSENRTGRVDRRPIGLSSMCLSASLTTTGVKRIRKIEISV